MNPGVLVIGLDSADAALTEAWCESGDLPLLQQLKAIGVSGHLNTPAAMGDDAVWASFSTAVSPAQHGRYFNQALLPGSYEAPGFQNSYLKRPVFWEILGKADKRIAVIDVPKNPLAKTLNGVQLSDWLVHGRDGPTVSLPEQFAADVINGFGGDTTDIWGSSDWLCAMLSIEESQRELLSHRLVDSVERKTALLLQMLRREHWDLFLAVFKECHCAGHQLWPSCADGGVDNKLLKTVYQSVDAALGKILAQSGEGMNVLIFSGLGMAENISGNYLLDIVLRRFEKWYLPWTKSFAVSADIAYHALVQKIRRNGLTSSPFRKRLAFQVQHNEISGAVRVNLKGREPNGQVHPAEYDDFCDELERQFMLLRDPVSGNPLVEHVVFCRKAFAGEHQNKLPDLLVKWARTGPISGASSPDLGTFRMAMPNYRPGNHVEGGFYIASGPLFTEKSIGPDGSIMDIGPTVAKLLRTKLRGVEGVPLDIFK
jgi:predicted AlkP superfamily phosphohydrolase/phosphomutase